MGSFVGVELGEVNLVIIEFLIVVENIVVLSWKEIVFFDVWGFEFWVCGLRN